MRKTVPALFVVALVPALIVLPVVTPPRAAPHPVAPHIVSEPLAGVDSSALVAARAQVSASSPTVERAPAVLTPAMATAKYQLLGITWDSAANAAGFQASVRIRPSGKAWGAWEPLSVGDAGPDAGSVDARQGRSCTEPLVTGPSDGVQVRVDTASGAAPAGLRLELVDPGTSAADASIGAAAPASSAAAAMNQPAIVSRAQWGADEALRNGFAGYSPTIKVGFVHHTVSQNTYTSAAGAAAQIRAIYAYDTEGLGWSDIAYNFLVDKFGNIYEGRAGGVTQAVIGSHTAGFNYDSFAVAALGCFDTTCSGGGLHPPAAMVTSIAKVMAWKLGLFYRDPSGTGTLISSGISGTNLHHPAGQAVTVPTISGHRDVDATACPGNLLYPMLPSIRAQASAFLAVGFVGPGLSASSGSYGSAGPTITSGVLSPQSWTGSVSDVCRGGGAIDTLPAGSATRTAPLTTSWNGMTSGSAWARPGPYRISLSGGSAQGTALPWSGTYTVNGPAPSPPTLAAPVSGDGGYHPVTPFRILDTRPGTYSNGPGGRIDLKVLGVGGIPATGVTSVWLTVTATCPSAPTYLRVYAGETAAPATSNVNVTTGQTRAVLAAAPVGADGTISIGNAAGTSQVIVDVLGYGSASGGAELTPVPLTRVYDTRSMGGALGNGENRTLTLPTIAGIAPSGITAVVVNLTAYSPTTSGYLAVYPAGTAWPGVSSLNYSAGPGLDTSAVVGVNNGQIVLRNAGGTTNAAVDVIGVYTSHAVQAGSRFTAIDGQRALDTRVTGGSLGPGEARAVTVAGGTSPVPLGVKAVLISITAIAPTSGDSLIAWPADGSPMPPGAFLRMTAGDTRANVAVVAVAANGQIMLENAAGRTHAIIDVYGYYE